MRYKTVLLFGAPGSGKGTQGKILGAIPGFFHNASGDIFRSLDPKSEIGLVFGQYASQGKLVPDEITIGVWKNFIEKMEAAKRFNADTDILLMDGIPRNVAQAKLLEESIDVAKVIHLECRDMSKMVERLLGRALKEKRFDDANEEVVKNRLFVYEKESKPILAHYPADKIANIEATNSQIRVLSDILNVLAPLKDELDRVTPKN